MRAQPLNQHYLRNIVATASTIDERLSNHYLPDDTKASSEIADARLNEWCWNVAKGDWNRFRERLSCDDLDVDTIRRVLGTVWVPENSPLPTWVDTLSDALSRAADIRYAEVNGGQQVNHLSFLDAEKPLPFEEVVAPFVVVARKRLAIQSGSAYHLLNEEAHISLQRSLLQSLISYSAQALHLEFSIQRAQAQSPLARLLAQAQNDNERTNYQQFLEHMRQGGLVAFFQEYAVLARLLATITDLWVEANTEFLVRLASDWSEVQRVFGRDSELGQVITVEPALSDPHRGRRSVIALTFASGCKLVYKPKDLGTEEAYNQLLTWLNERDAPLDLKALTVINRSSHGWVEFAEHKPCKDHAEVQRYYQRAGMLLCLIYMLEGTDCHYENIIACGEYPVLVDMETLMHHRPCLEDTDEGTLAWVLAYEQLAYSVLRTGLLPNWLVRPDQQGVYDISGLGNIGDQELPLLGLKWERINTDRMELTHGTVKAKIQANQPLLNDIPLRLEAHAEDVLAGFTQMYRFLSNFRSALLASESPLYKLGQQQVRFVYRATRVYGSVMQKLFNPKYLRDGVERSIQLELLCRAVIPLEGPLSSKREFLRWWPVCAAERQTMEQADIPFFTAHANSDVLMVTSDQPIQGCLQEPSFDLVMTRLRGLGNEDLQQQIGFIQGSLYAHIAHDVSRSPSRTIDTADIHIETTGLLTSHELVAQAVAIAEQIALLAIRAEDGSAAWIAPQFLRHAERYQLQPMGHDLYSGTCGVVLFLAGLEKVTGGVGYRELALGALQPLRQALQHYGQRTARQLGIGGATGLGSIVYTLTQVSQLLDEPFLLVDARRAANLITADRLAKDNALDLIAGLAGALLGLLALYETSLDQEILGKAITCSEHLLHKRTESKTGYRAWATPTGSLLTGFSHGAAGIAYALLRLYAITHNENLLTAAQEGIAYEDSVFEPDVGNWPDFRTEKQPAFVTSWCHGAPGIGLARIGGLPVIDTDQIRKDIAIALERTQEPHMHGPDHLCCGQLGKAEILLSAASRLSYPELAEVARSQVWKVVARAKQTGSFLLDPLLPKQVYCPGFFQGTAGIGYTLLRMAYPDQLPSVLLWE